MPRSGKTREHYLRQKSQAFAYFRINAEDARKIADGQFTLFDFISDCFSFSQAKKRNAVAVLGELKQQPQTFKQLQEKLGLKKSTLFLVVLALERAGLVVKRGKNRPLALSSEFAANTRSVSSWWENWTAQTGV